VKRKVQNKRTKKRKSRKTTKAGKDQEKIQFKRKIPEKVWQKCRDDQMTSN